jgi:hypothetical protein
VANLEKVSEVLKVLYLKQENLKLVNAAIFSKTYTDESILLQDLIFPEISRLPSNKRFKQYATSWNLDIGKFASQFWTESEKRNDADFVTFLNEQRPPEISRMDIGNGYGDGVSIYFPYSEEFEVPDPYANQSSGYYAPITSVSTSTAEADEAWGQLPYYVNGVFQYYTQVLINDDYCFENPTHIIGVNGIELDDITTMEAPPPPVVPPGVNRVLLVGLIVRSSMMLYFQRQEMEEALKYNIVG